MERGAEAASAGWKLELEYEGAQLREAHPVQLCEAALREAGWNDEAAGDAALLVAELWHNALEHGVLGLDSEVKERSGGFSAYYAQREKALASLADGRVRISLVRERARRGDRLVVRVEDSGPGFVRAPLPRRGNLRKGGRGLLLVESLCEQLEFEGRGNVARAVLAWRGEEVLASEGGVSRQ